MRAARRGMALAMAAAGIASGLHGQDVGCRPGLTDSSLAHLYAPVLRFAPGERYFPTLPYFTAVDGVDNDGDSLVDLGDPSEVRPPLTAVIPNGRRSRQVGRTVRHHPLYATAAGDSLVDAYEIDRRYGARLAAAAAAPNDGEAIVRYRVRCLTGRQVELMRSYLRRDRQATKRFRFSQYEDLFDFEGGHGFAVVEYYLYYLNDTGLTGHEHDTEKIFVFVPLQDADAARLRMVVGAGHAPVTPNNILVLTGRLASKERRPNVLVELGGHSNSPDLPPYGQVRKGWDINWYLGRDVWGTRDLQSIGGIGYLADYDEWQALPRTNPYSVVLVPTATLKDSAANGGEIVRTYTLLSDTLLREFFQRASSRQSDPQELDSLHAAIASAVLRSSGQALALNGGGVNDSSMKAMRLWKREQYSQGTGHPVESAVARNWPNAKGHGGDADYKADPTDIFKPHLYGGRLGLQGELLLSPTFLPTLSIVSTLPTVSGMLLPGTIGLGLSYIDFGDDVSYYVAATYDAHAYRTFSWYTKVEFVSNRESVEQRETAPDLAFAVGVTWHPFYPIRKAGFRWAFNRFRLRLGLRPEWVDNGLSFQRVRPDVGISLTLPGGPWLW